MVIICDSTEPFYVNANFLFVISQFQDQYDYRKLGTSNYYFGFKYYPLHSKFKKAEKKLIRKHVLDILITFGGSDTEIGLFS